MNDQRNTEFQTLIISSTLMFGTMASIIIQGLLPYVPVDTKYATEAVYEAMAISTGASFTFLTLCIIVFTKIVLRTSKFMYERANRHSNRVHRIIDQTVDLMAELRWNI